MKSTLKKLAFCMGIFSLMLTSINAQDETDALRFSEIDWEGSARFMGAGKAFGAVGAEFSALNTNPASIGLYKKSEVTFNPMTISIFRNTSGYNGTASNAPNVKYNLGNAGIVLALPGISSTLWKKFQVGYGYNRIKNYNTIFNIQGNSAGSTIGSVLAEEANKLGVRHDVTNGPGFPNGPGGEEAWFGWRSFLIAPDYSVNNSYTYSALFEGIDMEQSSTVTRKGGNDEMVFSFGSNYDDKLFLGATLGVPFINFTESRIFEERINDELADSVWFQRATITDKLSVRATGINLKLGVIYQPLDFLRVGIAFHTPTYYGNVKDSFERRMYSEFYDLDKDGYKYLNNASTSYENRFNYTLNTPLRVMANVAFFINQRAFISAEYEFVDYSMANMYSINYNFNRENENIKAMYGISHIARIGAELNLTEVFAIRAGYNYISSPYKGDYRFIDGSQHYASAGFGFRTRIFYGDFAYAFTTSKQKYWMYDATFVNEVNNKFITHKVILSLGVRF